MAEPVHAEMCAVERDGAVLRLTGDIDEANLHDVTERVVAAVRAGVEHLDLRRVGHCGAAGVRAVLEGRDALPPGATLRVDCSPSAFRILHICGLVGADGLSIGQPGPDGWQAPGARR